MTSPHMAENEKGLGSKLIGLFVERPDDAKVEDGDKSPAELVAELAAQSNPAAKGAAGKLGVPGAAPAAASAPPPPNLKLDKMATPGQAPTDFDAIFKDAGMDAAELDRVKKAEELLKGLPEATPQDVKRQIVEASLKAFGVATAKIIEAGVAEIQALESLIQKGQADAQAVVADGNKRIAELEKQIGEVRVVMQQAVADQEARTRLANGEKLGIQQVLEFFGRDAVEKVVQESPKLKST